MPTLVLISRWLSPCAARRSTSLIWRIDNLFRGTGLLLAESGHFQQRSYGPSVLDGAAWAHSAETGGHFPPFWPGTFNQNDRAFSTARPGHFRPFYALPMLWASGRLSSAHKKELLRSLIRRVILKRTQPDVV